MTAKRRQITLLRIQFTVYNIDSVYDLKNKKAAVAAAFKNLSVGWLVNGS